MASDFSPMATSVLKRALFTGEAAYQAAGSKIDALVGGSGGNTGGGTGEGVSDSPVNLAEQEPNNTRLTAQYVPLGFGPGQSSVVNVTGRSSTIFDEDYYTFDLKKGDIFDTRVLGAVTGSVGVGLYDPSGNEIAFYTSPGNSIFPGTPPTKSPLFRDGLTSFSYVIDRDGRYTARVGDVTGAYTLNLRTYRPTIEQSPIGTRQTIFLDFNGETFRSETIPGLVQLGAPAGSLRVPPLSRYLTQIGLTAADEPALIADITARVQSKFNMIAQTANNGFYDATGTPGEYSFKIVNNLTDPNVWGRENVSRVIIGGTQLEIFNDDGNGLLGIAQSVDVGNFDREETALVMLDIIIDSVNNDIVYSGSATRAHAFAELLAMVIAHEAGHYLGGAHQNPNNDIYHVMDQFYDPVISSGSGLDGIFGTRDDVPLRFGEDEYSPNNPGIPTTASGLANSDNVLAFGMSTGKVGATVNGTIFNDVNRNGRIDGGDGGIAGWTLWADLNNDKMINNGEPRTATNSAGTYSLRVTPGTFNLRVSAAPDYVATLASSQLLTVATDQTVSGVNFGFNLPSNVATGFKWNDLNGDGVRDANEPGLAGIWMYLDIDGDDRLDIGEPAAKSGADGSYTLTPPAAGTYVIRENLEPGYLQTFPLSGEHVVSYNGSTPLKGFDFGNRVALDFGDAPTPYPTTAAQGGASAGFITGLSLGTNIDIDIDGQPNSTATGDNIVGLFNSNNEVINDEDGIVFQSQIIADGKARTLSAFLTNTTGQNAYLNGFIDLDKDGSWTGTNEQIVTNKLLTPGVNIVSYSIPSNAQLGGTFARFRLSQDLKTTSIGRSDAGEVEDYAVNIVGTSDTAVDDAFTVNRNSVANTLDVLANDFRVNNETLQIVSVSGGNNGGIIQIGAGKNSIRYTPRNGFIGRETFTYTAKNTAGDTDTATVTVDVTFSFDKPIAVDDSYNIAKNAIGVPLNVLANDVEGKDGALQIVAVTSPDQGGTALVGSGNQSIRYTPRRGFIGLETFTYTASDSAGNLTSAIISLHVGLPEDTNDVVGISIKYVDMAGNDLPGAVQQGTQFKAQVFVDDLRDTATLFGVFSAYFDLLYNSSLASPTQSAAGSAFNFRVSFAPPYNNVQRGANDVPGLVNELGATSSVFDLNNPEAVLFATITFDALAPGLFEIASDPAEDPNNDTDTTLMGANIVPVEQILFGRSSIEIVGNGFEFPVAVDDSIDLIPNTFDNIIDVLGNDSTGSTRSIKIRSVTQPLNGSVFIDDNGTSVLTDDVIKYTPNNQFTQSDQFTYTIQDDRGFTSTGTVTIHGVDDAIIDLGLQVTDLLGNSITQIALGQQFQLRGTIKDLRAAGANLGVFAAFQDILIYNSVPSGVTVNTATVSNVNPLGFQATFNTQGASEYSRVPNGDIRLTTLINELGSVQTGDAPLGNDVAYTQFIVTLTANKVGLARFVGDPADVSPFHDSLMFEPPEPVTFNRINYHSTSINVVAGTGGAGGEGFTNPNNRFDVNNDGVVSPIDVLLIINRLNQGGAGKLGGGEGEGAKYFVDVNADGFLSAIDALQVINTLNKGGANGEGEGEAALAAPSSKTSNLTSIATSAVGLETPRDSVYGPVTYGSSNRSNASSLSEYIASQEETDSIDSLIDSLANDVLGNWNKKKNS